jgi:hypothetical protein
MMTSENNNKTGINSPHDKVFKSSMADIRVAREFLVVFK